VKYRKTVALVRTAHACVHIIVQTCTQYSTEQLLQYSVILWTVTTAEALSTEEVSGLFPEKLTK